MKFKITISEVVEREVVLTADYPNFDAAWEELSEMSDAELIERVDAGEQIDLRVIGRDVVGLVEVA